MTTATPAPAAAPAAAPAPSSLDAALGKIDQLLGSAPTVQQMTQAELQTHVAAELEKALAEDATKSKARLEHLKAQVSTAKAVFDSGATLAPITMFKDPWQTLPGEGASKGSTDTPQPPTGDSNVQFKDDVLFVQTEKGREPSELFKALFIVAKAPDDSPVRKNLIAKGAEGAQIVQKAGEAMAVLEKIAAIFGYTPEPGETLANSDFRWSVSDTISALQSAARTENVIAQMTGLLGAATTKAAFTAAAPPAAPPAAAPAAAPAATPAPVEAWPLDMASATFDEKTGLMKAAGDAERSLYWGRDSEKAPTT